MKAKKLGITGGSLLAFGILICVIIFPPFLKSQIKKVSGVTGTYVINDILLRNSELVFSKNSIKLHKFIILIFYKNEYLEMK